MKEWILKLVVEWLLSNVSKEQIDEWMEKYVLPFLSKQRERLFQWIDELVASTESEVDDVLAQVLKYAIDALLPG
jgi:hypothetical protein